MSLKRDRLTRKNPVIDNQRRQMLNYCPNFIQRFQSFIPYFLAHFFARRPFWEKARTVIEPSVANSYLLSAVMGMC